MKENKGYKEELGMLQHMEEPTRCLQGRTSSAASALRLDTEERCLMYPSASPVLHMVTREQVAICISSFFLIITK